MREARIGRHREENVMHSTRTGRKTLILIGLIAGLMAMSAGVFAQGGPPPADAPPGDVGFKGTVLAGIEPVVAPGYRLVLAEAVFEPGAYVTSHVHPTAIVVCVQSGALGFAIQHGTATITRAAADGGEPTTETLPLNTETTLDPRDCVAFDHFASHTAHTGWNASDGQTVLMEARLLEMDTPFTVFVDAEGTPVP
jgi:hypothetical protein